MAAGLASADFFEVVDFVEEDDFGEAEGLGDAEAWGIGAAGLVPGCVSVEQAVSRARAVTKTEAEESFIAFVNRRKTPQSPKSCEEYPVFFTGCTHVPEGGIFAGSRH